MKTKRTAICAAIAIAASTGAFAQQSSQSQQQPQQQQQRNNVPLHGQSQMFFRADKLVGLSAQTPVGQELGKIQEIAFNPEKGIYGVVKASNDRLVPLPWTLVTAVTDKAVVFNTSAQAMSGAPSFTDNQWSKMNDPQFTQQLDSHFQSAMGGSSGQGVQGASAGAGASQHESSSSTQEAESSSISATNSTSTTESQDQ